MISRALSSSTASAASALAASALLMAAAGWAGCARVKGDGATGGTGGTTGGAIADGAVSYDLGVRGEVGSGGPSAIDGGDDAMNCAHTLHAAIRDFKGQVTTAGEIKHPDFEYEVGDDRGLVAPMLGTDDKPVYAPAGPTKTTHGAEAFNQWYRDVDGVNLRFEVDIPLTADASRPGTYVYDTNAYFPIDGMGFGNQYQSHNFDFTSEFHFNFPYRGGEQFTFRGDDDLWLFVNGRLAIDLGGVHVAQTATVDLDAQAQQLGITKGAFYRMDIFQAERHLAESNFRIETTLQCIDNIVIP